MGNDANVSNPFGIGVMRQMGLRMNTPKDSCEILKRGIWPTGANGGGQPYKAEESGLRMAMPTRSWDEHCQTRRPRSSEFCFQTSLQDINWCLIVQLRLRRRRIPNFHQVNFRVVGRSNVIVKLLMAVSGGHQ